MKKSDFPPSPPSNNEDSIAQLIRMTGPEPEIDSDLRDRVRSKVRQEWTSVVVQPRRRRRLWLRWAALVTLLLGGLSFWPRSTEVEVPGELQWLRVERMTGPFEIRDSADASAWRRVTNAGENLAQGVEIRTDSQTRISFSLEGHASLRLDQNTHLQWFGSSQFELSEGAVYFDSMGEGGVEIATVFGRVRDVGTQFEVRVSSKDLRVRIREGLVEVQTESQIRRAEMGHQLSLDSHGQWVSERIALNDAEWDWTLAVAPSFDLEGQTLGSFLQWTAREMGLELTYLPEGLRREEESTLLHGSVHGMRPDEALEAVLPTCGLVARIDQGRVEIRRERPNQDGVQSP